MFSEWLASFCHFPRDSAVSLSVRSCLVPQVDHWLHNWTQLILRHILLRPDSYVTRKPSRWALDNRRWFGVCWKDHASCHFWFVQLRHKKSGWDTGQWWFFHLQIAQGGIDWTSEHGALGLPGWLWPHGEENVGAAWQRTFCRKKTGAFCLFFWGLRWLFGPKLRWILDRKSVFFVTFEPNIFFKGFEAEPETTTVFWQNKKLGISTTSCIFNASPISKHHISKYYRTNVRKTLIREVCRVLTAW